LPVKVSEPDLFELPSSESSVRLNSILNDVKEMSSCLYNNGDINDVLDVETTARFFLANDYVLNQEINHPKSTFLYKDESDPNGKLTFGPIWDFDWGFGYEANHSYCYNGATNSIINVSMNAHMFWDDLKTNSIFKRYYYKVWKEFLEKNSIDELMDYIDSYYEFAKESFVNNQNEWGYSYGFTKDDAERAKEWLVQRKNYLYNGLSKSDIEDLIHALAGDVNCNDQLTVHDVALVTAYMNGYTHKDFNLKKADCDGNGSVGDADVAAVAACVIGSEAPSSMYWYKTTLAAGELNDQGILAHINDIRAENIRERGDILPVFGIYPDFHQHQLTADAVFRLQDLDVTDIHLLGQLVADLLQDQVIAGTDDGDARIARIRRHTCRNAVDVVSPARKKAGHPGQQTGGVVNKQ
jgi:hypothetical protein